MPLIKELESLKAFGCEDRCVLSMYLNTNPGDPELLNGGWKILLKKGLNGIEEYLTASEDDTELKAFKKLKKKVTEELENNTNNLKKVSSYLLQSNLSFGRFTMFKFLSKQAFTGKTSR